MIASARRAAFDALRAVEAGRSDLPTALAHARRSLSDPRDQALAAEIATGTLRWRGALDAVLARHVTRPLDRLDVRVLDTLRLGAYQLLYLDRVPPHAVIHDAVEIVRRAGVTSAAGLVNAALRAVQRDRTRPSWPPDPGPEGSREAQVEFISVTMSHPRWLADRWIERVGFHNARAWAAFNNERAPLTLRVNTLAGTRASLVRALADAGVHVESTRFAPDGLIVRAGNPLSTPLAESGRFFVQDEASQVVATMTLARPGERVLDACASPGGKTTAMSAMMADQGLIAAVDLRPRRLALLSRTVATSRACRIARVRADVTKPLPFDQVFDLALLDAPCSGLGTIRRDPEIRWRRTLADLPRLADTQVSMLRRVSEVVRPGGRLVYATCSSEPEENDEVVDRFLTAQPEFEPVERRALEATLPPGVLSLVDADGRLRPRPWRDGLEPFFAAILMKYKNL
jgi:16S rRNA (cytosine967-C5)-methyltransferase